MTLPVAFYSEPRFRSSSPDLEKLRDVTELTLDTPGASFALAMDYYRVEAFADEDDRDLACGPTAHDDVRYFPAQRDALIRNGTNLRDIGCGHSLDHPAFEEILAPIFHCAVQQVVGEASRVLDETDAVSDTIATWPIAIARARYKLSIVKVGEWLNFDVVAMSVFEKASDDTMDRTLAYLQDQLVKKFPPGLRRHPGRRR